MNITKKHVLIIIAAIVTLSSFTNFISADWFLLKKSEQNYQVQFPKKPIQNKQKVPSPIGDLIMDIYMYEATEGDDNLVYMVNYTKYPANSVNSNNTEKLEGFFEGAINGAVSNVQGKLLSKKDVKLGKYPGKEITIDFQNGLAVIRSRMYLVEDQMYMVQTIAETAKNGNSAATRFMNSFKLIK